MDKFRISSPSTEYNLKLAPSFAIVEWNIRRYSSGHIDNQSLPDRDSGKYHCSATTTSTWFRHLAARRERIRFEGFPFVCAVPLIYNFIFIIRNAIFERAALFSRDPSRPSCTARRWCQEQMWNSGALISFPSAHLLGCRRSEFNLFTVPCLVRQCQWSVNCPLSLLAEPWTTFESIPITQLVKWSESRYAVRCSSSSREPSELRKRSDWMSQHTKT